MTAEILETILREGREFRGEMQTFQLETRNNFGSMFRRLNDVEARLTAIEARMAAREHFDELEKRIAALEAR